MLVSMEIGNPMPLKQNSGKSFQGSIVLGKGFVLTRDEAEGLIKKDPRNKDVLFPYLNGDDLNNDPEQKPSRWVINFFDWSEEKAKSYPDCFEIVERLVKPERQKQKDKIGKEVWWRFLRSRSELYKTISKLDQVMAINRHSKHLLVAIGQKGIVYSDATIVFALYSYCDYAILSSSIHEVWAWKNSSTMGASTLRYSAVNAFETFPFPEGASIDLEKMGHELNIRRRQWTISNQKGLTDLQNLYHTNTNQAHVQVEQLRNLCCQIDYEVLKSYGWDDIDLNHGFYELDYLPENDRVRFTLNPNIRKEIITRLIMLNQKLYKREVESDQTVRKKIGKNKPSQSINLFQ